MSSRDTDVALLFAPTEDEKGARMLRVRDGELRAGEVRPHVEGRALCGQELVRLRPRPKFPALCDVEVIQPADPAVRRSPGPAQIASDEYRRNWDRTFGDQPPAKTGRAN